MNKFVIVADDSELVKRIIENALMGKYIVIKASNGKEVMDFINNNDNENIAAVLLDLNMPEFDGFVVLDYFKNNRLFKKIPVSIISGDDSKETISKAFSYDIVDMLHKPFNMRNVRNIIEKMENNKKVN